MTRRSFGDNRVPHASCQAFVLRKCFLVVNNNKVTFCREPVRQKNGLCFVQFVGVRKATQSMWNGIWKDPKGARRVARVGGSWHHLIIRESATSGQYCIILRLHHRRGSNTIKWRQAVVKWSAPGFLLSASGIGTPNHAPSSQGLPPSCVDVLFCFSIG